MSKSMLINVILSEESRVAIVDNGILDFFEIETLRKETLKGNIYKGVVENVNSALQAAFVNCGWERPGFLPLDEVNFHVLPVLKGRKGASPIQERLGPGMEVLVQVIRDKFNNKPPSLTTYYSLPGRYLVLTPYTDASGVSRRIEDEGQRAKLKKLVDELRPPEKYGVIVRTAGIDQEGKELVRDMGYLIRLWETIERAAEGAPAPALIYREHSLALRTIRDNLTDDVEEVWIDDQDVHESALRFIRAVAPNQESRIHLYSGDKPLFTRHNLEDQIETIYKRRVPLKSGGEIVIEETEAMTAIDVNSSRSRESKVEDLALRTNLEAATEVARQLRLRDIGGLIVIDFIDMEAAKHIRSVEKALFEAMRRDKAKYDATKISKLGILEISRQRLKAAKAAATYTTCAACDGAGIVRTTEAAAFSALRRIQTRVVRGDAGVLTVSVPTDVALYLLNEQRDELLALERRYDVRIHLLPRAEFPKERCEIEAAPREGPALPAQGAERGQGPGKRETLLDRDARIEREGSAARAAWAPVVAGVVEEGISGSQPVPGARGLAEGVATETAPVVPAWSGPAEASQSPGEASSETLKAIPSQVTLPAAGEAPGAGSNLAEGAAAEGGARSGTGRGRRALERGGAGVRGGSTRAKAIRAKRGARAEVTSEATKATLPDDPATMAMAPIPADSRSESWSALPEEIFQSPAPEDRGGPEDVPAPILAGSEEAPFFPPWGRAEPEASGPDVDGRPEEPLSVEAEARPVADTAQPGGSPMGGGVADGSGKRRRRRRGGRGRSKKRPDLEAEASKAVEAEDGDIEDRIVWEDAEEETPAWSGPPIANASASHATRPSRPSPARESSGHEQGLAEAGADLSGSLRPGTDAAAGAGAKRRRRRGKKKTHDRSEEIRPVAGASSGNAPAVRREPVPKRGDDRDEVDPASQRRRRRHKSHKRLPGVEGASASIPRPSGHSTPVEAEGARPMAVKPVRAPEVDENVPGGWWSRLRGVKNRGDRED